MLLFRTKTVRLMLGSPSISKVRGWRSWSTTFRPSDGWRRIPYQWETFSGEVVVAESISLVGIIKENKPPTAVGWLRALGDDGEFGVRAPNRAEVVGDLLLQRRDGGRDIRVGQHGALVD